MGIGRLPRQNAKKIILRSFTSVREHYCVKTKTKKKNGIMVPLQKNPSALYITTSTRAEELQINGWLAGRIYVGVTIMANNIMKVCTLYSENLYGDIIIMEENLVEISLIIVEILVVGFDQNWLKKELIS